MRFLFKTSYNQDIRIFRDKVAGFGTGCSPSSLLSCRC